MNECIKIKLVGTHKKIDAHTLRYYEWQIDLAKEIDLRRHES